MTVTQSKPSPEAQIMLEALRDTARKTLERKRRLGQYAVIWQNGRPALVGEDAPEDQCQGRVSTTSSDRQ